MPNVGIIGRARVGKDTAGAWFVRERGYKRVALADPLKEAALKLDPIVGTEDDFWAVEGDRLSDVVGFWGWEKAKELPEVRRTLQELGAAIRAIDSEFWLRGALKSVQDANEGGQPAVITDVRYPNEAAALKRAGVRLLHINRPGIAHLDHESEGALGPEDAHFMICNDGTIDAFRDQLRFIADEINHIESARHYGRSYS